MAEFVVPMRKGIKDGMARQGCKLEVLPVVKSKIQETTRLGSELKDTRRVFTKARLYKQVPTGTQVQRKKEKKRLR